MMTIGGVVLAPLSYELYRARLVAEQARVITEMNGQYVLARRRNSYSAWLAERLWPGRSEFLARDVDGASFYEPCEVTYLDRVPSLRNLTFGQAVTVGDPAFTHTGVRSLRLSANADLDTSESFAERKLLTRFPLVEQIHLDRVVPSQAMIDDLATCEYAQRLGVIFVQPFLRSGPMQKMALIDFAPLTRLNDLEQLQISEVAKGTDWSFLAELKQLEVVYLCPLGTYSLGGTEENWIRNFGPIPPREQSPFHYLCELPALKKVELYGTPAYQADIEQLVANSPIEELRLDVLPDGLDSLRPLQNAKSLRKLHVSISYFGDNAEAARTLLESLKIGSLSLGPPYDNAR